MERLHSTPCNILAATIITLVLEPTDALLASNLIPLTLHRLIRLRHPRPSSVPTGAAQKVPIPCARVRQTVKLVVIAPFVFAGVVMSIPLLVLNVLPVRTRNLLSLNGTDSVNLVVIACRPVRARPNVVHCRVGDNLMALPTPDGLTLPPW